MNIKKLYIIAAVILLAAASCFMYYRSDSSVSENSDVIQEEEIPELEEGNGIFFDEEFEDAEFGKIANPPDKFYGDWHSTSDQSVYLYDHISITVYEDGTWRGDVTDDIFMGTWVQDDYGLSLTSELINCKLYFADTGSLIMEDYRFDDYDDPIITVLTRGTK